MQGLSFALFDCFQTYLNSRIQYDRLRTDAYCKRIHPSPIKADKKADNNERLIL